MRFHMIKTAVTAWLCVVGVNINSSRDIASRGYFMFRVDASVGNHARNRFDAHRSGDNRLSVVANDWHYFVMPDSVKEMLRSDGTAFTVIGDSNIVAGVLPIPMVRPNIPLSSAWLPRRIQDTEIAPLTNYVAAGGFLFVGSSAFTRNPDGTTRTNFALASAMGVNMVNPGLTNWVSI